MNEMRRVLALLLCFVMLVGMLPAGALATDVQTTEPSEAVVETQVTEATDAAQETTLAAETESIPTESVEESVPATTVVTEPAETTDETTAPTEIVVEDTVVETLGEVDPEEILSSVEALDQALAAVEYSTPDGFVDAAIFFTDLHSNKSGGGDYKESTIKSVFGSIATNSKLPFSVVTSVGDAFSSNETAYTANTSTITKYIRTYLQDEDVAVKYTWSDHDRSTDVENFTGLLYGAGEDGTPGTADDGNYYIYAISMSDMTTDPRYSTKATFTSSLLTEFTDTVAKLDQTKPLFIASHMPLLVRRGDNGHALEWCNVINEAALKMDVAFFFGHNHKHDRVSDYHYGKGDTMSVQGNGTSKNVELNFHHFCAGYLEPTSTGSVNPTTSRTGTAMVVTILKDSIQYTVYDENGVYGGSIGGKIDLSVKREHAAPAEPTVNTVTFADDYTIITATALGLTDIDVNYVEDAIPEFGDNYYVAFDASLTGHTFGNQITYTIQAEDGMGADLSLFYVGENGALEELEYTSSTTDDGFTVLTFTTDKVGTFAYGVMPQVIPEGAVVSSLSITAPEKRNYFLSVDTENDGRVYLDISGLVVKAVYVHEDENYEKTVDWNRFDETVDGYSLSFGDLTEPGKKTVTVSYEGVSETFDVWVCAEKLEIEDVVIDFDEPSVITANITAGEPSAIAQAALQGLLTGNVVMYSIVPTYGEGITELVGKAYVTLPIPEDVTNPAVYYVSPKGAVEQMPTVNNGNGTLTFTTEHFSDFIVGEGTTINAPDNQTQTGNGSVTTTTKKTVYVLTSSVSAGNAYLIANSNAAGDTTRYLLANNNGSVAATGVTIKSGNIDSDTANEIYIELDDATDELWTVSGSSSTTLKNGSYYLRYNNGLSLSTTNSSTWTYSSSNNRLTTSNRRLRYNNGWTTSSNNGNVYFYVPTEIEVETTTQISGTYKIDSEEIFVSVKEGTTANLSSTLTFTPVSGAVTETDVSTTAEYKVVTVDKDGNTVDGDPNNIISGNITNGVVTFSGNYGVALIEASYSTTLGKVTDYFTITAKAPVYSLVVTKPDVNQLKIGNTVDLVAKTYMDDVEMTGQTITWTSSDDSIATVDENGNVTGVKGGSVKITASWTDPKGVEHTETIDLEIVDYVWTLDLCKPVGGTYESITKPIVIKDVVDNQTYTNIWAVITKDGVDVGTLSEEQLKKLSFISSNPDIATVDQATGLVTFHGKKGAVAITAVYEYAEGKSVTDTVIFSVSPDHYFVPEDGTDDFPEYPNEGAIRFDKTATAVGNFSQTGITKVELSMTGVPYGRGVDVVVVIDTSSSMKKDKDGNDQSSYTSPNARYAIMKQSLQDMLNAFAEADDNGNRPDIDLAIVDFNGYSDSPTRGNSNNFIPYSNLTANDTTTDRTGANKGRVYTGNGNGAYILNTTLGANHFENTGSEAFDADRISEILNYFREGSSGTNYDFGIQSAYQLLSAKKTANEADGEVRDQYVIFLTDGAPFRYNGFTCNNQSGRAYMNVLLGGDYADADDLKDAFTQWTMPDAVAAMYNPVNGTHPHRMAEAIKGIPGETYWVVDATKTTYVLNGTDTGSYLKPYDGLGAKFYSIGFCIADDQYSDSGVVTEETSYEVIRTLSSGQGYYWEDVESREELSGAFTTIAKSIIDAAKDVKVVDTMGEKYTMVFELPNDNMADVMEGTGFGADNPFYIEVKDYPLYPVDANGNKVSATSENIADYKRDTVNAKSLIKLYLGRDRDTYFAAKDGSGTRFNAPVFNTNPVGTKRYWTKTAPADLTNAVSITVQESGANVTYYFVKAGNGTHNIASGAYAFGNIVHQKTIVNMEEASKEVTTNECNDLIIATPYFVYNAATKELVWTTEKLSTSELAISYFLYLERSGGFVGSEKEIDPDTYTTNKAAYLYYTNFNGVECEQEFPVPQMTWNGAQVSYVFYLVNEDGQPVNRAGTVVPFSEAVYVTDVNTYAIIWNRLEQAAGLEAERLAHDLVPDVYELYDHGAKYNIHVYENENYVNLNNHFVIESGFGADGPFTTYVFNTKADDTKYRDPGAYAVNSIYLCKSYLPEGSYTVSGNTVTSATYTKIDGETQMQAAVLSQQKDENGNTYLPGATIIDGFAYYIDAEGKVYTIVQKTDAKRVHGGFDFANTTVAFAVVWKPQLKEDTVVIDYGLDVSIDVIANDAMAAGVVGVRTDKPSVKINEGTYAAAKATSVDLMLNNVKVATATVGSLTNVRVSLDKTNGMLINEPMLFYYETDVNYYVNGVLQSPSMYSSVTVIPATTVYYEDEYVTLKTFTKDGNSYKETSGWDTNSTAAGAVQETDRPGPNKITEIYDADNNYGYDAAYSNMSIHSMGKAAKVNVTEGKYATAEFTFYGTGFDIISLTSATTGNITINVYGFGEDGKVQDSPVQSEVVDTYYGYRRQYVMVTYTYRNGDWIGQETEVDALGFASTRPENPKNGDTYVTYETRWLTTTSDDSNALYQVPIMKIGDGKTTPVLKYGKYKAVITATYIPFLDHNKTDSGYNFYLDAIRIYNPTGNQNQEANDAYIADGEAYPEYFEVRDQIISKNTFDSLNSDSVSGIVFIDGGIAEPSVEDYTSYGPNNETYLANGQAIAFDLNGAYSVPTGKKLEKIQLAIKTVGGTGKVEVYGVKNGKNTPCLDETINTATDMYYDITALDGQTVVIKSTGEAIISITNVKVTYAPIENVASAASVEAEAPALFTISRASAEAAIASMTVEEDEVPETTVPEETEPETTVPAETEPEVTTPEETEPEEEQNRIDNIVNEVVETIRSILDNLFGRWFR